MGREECRRTRMASMQKLSKLVREDMSKYYLRNFQNDGYKEVVFTANIAADPECKVLDRNIYNIEDLLRLDNPLFRISHPNCLCKFDPYGTSSKQTVPQTQAPTPTPLGQGMPGGAGISTPRI